MADFDRAEGELHVKVLYAGPARSGKSTSVQVLAREAAKNGRAVGSMPVASNSSGALMERLQVCLGRVFGGRYTAYVHVVVAPSGAALDPTHRHLLRTCDAVVFVADANPARSHENLRALALLDADLKREGRDRRALPFVVQWNKRDLADVEDDAVARRAFAAGEPAVETVATRGVGVIAAFQRACLPAVRQGGDAHGLAPRRVEAEPVAAGATLASDDPRRSKTGTRGLGRLFDRARALFVDRGKAAS